MFTKEEHQKLMELTNSNEDFAFFINKFKKEYKLLPSQISHEIRNPLTLINSTIQLIESNYPETKEFKYWNQLNKDVTDLELLLTDLSMYSHCEVIFKENDDFLLLIKSVLSTFRPLAEQNGITLSLTITEDEIPYYNDYPFDHIKMKQVFVNLIRNAFEATKRGDYINILCAIDLQKHLVITISNNGKMIPEDELPKIFQPFVSFKSGGSGLGLAISSSIIASHDGSIIADSTEDKTSFTIYLPLYE